jgi:hypothetical protein
MALNLPWAKDGCLGPWKRGAGCDARLAKRKAKPPGGGTLGVRALS